VAQDDRLRRPDLTGGHIMMLRPAVPARDAAAGELAEVAASRGPATPHALELRHLRYLVAVAEAGTFTRAAERIFVAQPTLSQQIRRLEELVGTPLLQRGRDGLRLTDAGQVLLEESRAVLSLVELGLSRSRQAAGLGRPRLRVAIDPDMPEVLAAAIASRLSDTSAAADVDVAWRDASLDDEFSLVGQRQADAGLGWRPPAAQVLPASLDAMTLGEFEPETWVPSAHPAARRQAISLPELACMDVLHGPRRAGAGIYGAWRAVLRSADRRFEFTDPPFQRSLAMTLAFAATASRPTAVLTGPRHPRGPRDATADGLAADAYGMVCVRVTQSALAATAALVWHCDLPRPLQQVLFDTADGNTPGQPHRIGAAYGARATATFSAAGAPDELQG
jgi:DNA-binding transcriptional LysR family regulator